MAASLQSRLWISCPTRSFKAVSSRPTCVPRPARRWSAAAVHASQAGGAAAAMAFHIGETTVSFPLRAEEAQRLSGALVGIMQVFADKQKAERPQRWAALEYVFRGDAAAREIEYLEVFCNPNAHATAFDARALITLRTADGLRVTTEGKLTGIKADVDEYLHQLAA